MIVGDVITLVKKMVRLETAVFFFFFNLGSWLRRRENGGKGIWDFHKRKRGINYTEQKILRGTDSWGNGLGLASGTVWFYF